MKTIFYSILLTLISSTFAFSQTQKGIDSQTQKIKEDTNKTSRSNDVSRSWDFGKDKTKIRARLSNPIRLNARRDVLIENIIEVLKEQQIIIDEAASRLKDGLIITQPFTFAKGPVIAKTKLAQYAILPNSDTSWTRGRFTLTIEVQSIDGIQNNVSVTAKVEGRSENGLMSEWTTLQSSGEAEEQFLTKLVELQTGVSPDEQPDDNR
jgi:hypothetical protein